MAAAGAAVATVVPNPASARNPGAALVAYPSARLANLKELKVDAPLEVAYPDPTSPCVLLKLDQPVEGGAGPDRDIVGFSTLCPHKGYPLSYVAGDRTLNCPGHYSRFDCEKGGLQIWGQSTQNLPQLALRIDDKGDVFAEGVDELIYGRLANVLA